jgi:hypothetical protein
MKSTQQPSAQIYSPSVYIDVAIAAVNITSKFAPDDRHVPGVYSVMVRRDAPPAKVASAAMDLFHAKCPVRVLEDFSFYVFDPRTGQILDEDEDHINGSSLHLVCDLLRIGDRTPRRYSVTVDALGDEGELCRAGEVQIAADNKTEANRKALEIVWDARLDAAGCKPQFTTERIEPQ